MDIVDEIQRVIEEHESYARLILTLDKSRNKILDLREDIEDMQRRERSTAIQELGNEGQWNDLVAAKDLEIERLQEDLRLERQLRDDALRAFNEARAALKEGE